MIGVCSSTVRVMLDVDATSRSSELFSRLLELGPAPLSMRQWGGTSKALLLQAGGGTQGIIA